MVPGYIYVLVNSSMPGLVRLSRTVQLSSARLNKLLGDTGVATPFIVAFEESFDDCGAAEAAVHAELEHQGFHPAQDGELFLASPNAVIRIVLGVSARAKMSNSGDKINKNDESSRAWDGILAEAEALFDPQGDSLQDVDEAIRLYEVATRMGSSQACCTLGTIYFYGLNVREDLSKALDWFREGAKRGHYECHYWMARVFCKQGHSENALKALRRCFDEIEALKSSHLPVTGHDGFLEQYIQLCLEHQLPIEFADEAAVARDKIFSRVSLRLTDKISIEERKNLTRVRDALSNT